MSKYLLALGIIGALMIVFCLGCHGGGASNGDGNGDGNGNGSGGSGGDVPPGGSSSGNRPPGAGNYCDYKLHIPIEYDPAKATPLVVINDTHKQWVTIFGGTTGKGWVYISDELTFILAAFDLTNTTGHPIDSQCEAILSGIDQIASLYNVDISKIYFSGCCRFARMVLEWSIYRPDYFAASHIDSCTGKGSRSEMEAWEGRKMPVIIVQPSGHMPNYCGEAKVNLESAGFEVVVKSCRMGDPSYEDAMLESMEWLLQKKNPSPGGGMP